MIIGSEVNFVNRRMDAKAIFHIYILRLPRYSFKIMDNRFNMYNFLLTGKRRLSVQPVHVAFNLEQAT